MKKWITERKFNKLYDQLSDDLREKAEDDGTRIYTPDNFSKWMERVIDMPEYRVIGIRHLFFMLKEKIKDLYMDRKMKKLSLGKLIYTDENEKYGSYRVEKISFDVLWQMNRMLAIIIRDHLRSFIKETPAIGNCVIDHDPERKPWIKYSEEELEVFDKRWKDAVENTADEFDKLRKLIETSENEQNVDQDEIKEQTKKAFEALSFIFCDLCW